MDNQDTGIIVTQQSVDVQGAADYQKTLDSRWPSLDIVLEQEVEMIHSDSGTTHWWVEKLLDHNLGYLPAFTSRVIALDLGGLNPLFFNTEIIATKKSIFLRHLFVAGDPTAPIRLKAFFRVFACDITKEFVAPVDIIIPGLKPSYSDVGVKILKNSGATMRSQDVSDYSLNTRAKALSIHLTGVRQANFANMGTLTINHKLGYPPTLFVARTQTPADFFGIFANPLPNDNIIAPMTPAAGARVTATANDVFIRGGQAALIGNFAVLITKEPEELAV